MERCPVAPSSKELEGWRRFLLSRAAIFWTLPYGHKEWRGQHLESVKTTKALLVNSLMSRGLGQEKFLAADASSDA
eukprot:6743835-Prorocentrum_lima.AAC.1